MSDATDPQRRWQPEGAETLLGRVVEHAPLVLWAIDRDGTLTLSEGRALSSLGLRPGQALGQSVWELYRDYPGLVASLERALAGEQFTERVEVANVHFETHHWPQLDADGPVSGVMDVSIDITEIVRAERERERLAEQLLQSKKLEGLGLMAGGIAHEFNNILTAIMGSASTAKASLPTGHPARRDLESLIASARRASDLTRQMLAYSGRGPVELRATDLSALVRETVALIEASAHGNVRFLVQLEEGLPAVRADPAQIRQVLMNLAVNGAEAIGEAAGTVRISTAREQVDERRAAELKPTGAVEPGEFAVVEVRDSGCGMDPATLARIFDPFYSTKFAGRGLGLAATLGIVRAHGGSLTVTSTPGRGTVFRLLLPAARAPLPAAPPKREGFRGSGLALVVDDDEGVRTVAQRMLVHLGFEVVEASDGREGLEVFGRCAERLALVVLDLTMPRLRGDEVFRRMRQVREDLPILLTSGFTELEAGDILSSSSRVDFVQKPFSLADLRSRVAAVLGHAQDGPA